jgi:cytochrome c oxidase subunit I
MAFVVSFLLLFSLPIVAVGLFQVYLDRNLGTVFFEAAGGGDPLLWQHLFWLFGHPEVYVLILPAMGIVSEVLPTFSRKPLFGRAFVIFSGIAIGFMGFGVWAHHMFTAGLGPVAEATFAITTMFIAVPTGVKIFNWLGTVWGGKLTLNTAMLFSLGLVGMFTIGGLSGVTHSVSPHNTQQHDTYYIVAHFHYVLFGGALFGLFAGIYYWWPKAFGHFMNETLGKWHFWTFIVGFNLTFGPMHILGLQGMIRRAATYPEGMGWDLMNLLATIGSFIIALGFLIWIVNVIVSRKQNVRASADPWDARTLEWSIASPPPEHNFDVEPVVTHLDDFWHQKYTEDESGRLVRMDTGTVVTSVDEHGSAGISEGAGATPSTAPEADADAQVHAHAHGIHLPSPSYWPIISALGLPLVAYGLIYTYWLAAVGGLLVVASIYGWGLEPSVEPDEQVEIVDPGAGPRPGADEGAEAEPEPAGVEA